MRLAFLCHLNERKPRGVAFPQLRWFGSDHLALQSPVCFSADDEATRVWPAARLAPSAGRSGSDWAAPREAEAHTFGACCPVGSEKVEHVMYFWFCPQTNKQSVIFLSTKNCFFFVFFCGTLLKRIWASASLAVQLLRVGKIGRLCALSLNLFFLCGDSSSCHSLCLYALIKKKYSLPLIVIELD